MAQAWTQHLFGERIEAWSAGTEPAGLDERALEVMRQAGLPTASLWSKPLAAVSHRAPFDLVVTVCDRAAKRCPTFAGARARAHVPFPDPPRLGARAADPAQALACYRRVCEQIGRWVAEELPRHLGLPR